ncbi:S41 family peptidase [Phnomibacter ginsenosidimutans]|uniref:Tricorn protease homolog n=1 Tax=Phnomibacter ginsenosidimutans TaxID=2676868 RepID=A0A6I6G377_9BACT|nr:S41 family peptidase [Phnomibacter ginsenosidimutans]QGW27086.1 peptidase S41 [Phnomibacter ginsenosidimutans]
MKHILWCCLLFASQVLAQNNSAHFMAYPSLTPDGQTILFSYEGDIWSVPAAGGTAVRLTAMPGYETNARVSPDGKWLAFTGRQFGNADVFVMPFTGGEIRQLTWHSSSDDVDSWSWDSQFIYFTSGRDSRQSGYKVSLQGGTPVRVLSDYYFSYDHNLWEHPQSKDIYFTDSWESTNQAYRKRYKGAFAPDIQSYNPQTKQFKKYTDYNGKDFAHSIDQKGNVYFISDEANGEYNLYTLTAGKKKGLTKFNTSIKWPQVAANGSKVVFEKDYQIWSYDVAKDKATAVDIRITRNYVLPKDKDFSVAGEITQFDVSPDGKKLAFTSRGELFVSDVEGKFVRMINKGNAERATEVKWLSDNKSLLFLQTINGYSNPCVVAADGSSAVKVLAQDAANARFLSLNSKRTQAAYISGRGEVKLIDTKTYAISTVLKDEIWGNRGSVPFFSPNDEYLTLNVYRNFETDIVVHQLKTGKTTNLTNTGVTEADPMWSPDSKYLYFVSNPLKPAYPFGLSPARVYRVALEKFDDPYRQDKVDELFQQEKKDTTKKKDSVASLRIDTQRFLERMEMVGPAVGNQYLVTVLQKGEKQMVLYVSDHAEGRSSLWKTTYEPFEQPKTERIQGADGFGYEVIGADGKYFVLMRGNIARLNLDANKAEPITINYTFRRNLAEEFNQMFAEAWAQMEENFYDDSFRGLDWKAIKARYAAHLPYVNTRLDLRVLLNDMLGELNSSHTGFSTFGDDENVVLQNRTVEPGIVFEPNNPFTVKRIIARGPADKKGINIQPGDVLVKVNDVTIDPQQDRSRYFTQPSADKEMRLSFKNAAGTYTVSIHPTNNVSGLLYEEWIDANQQRVDSKSNQRIAYTHMKNMGTGELETFLTDMGRDFYQKDALILDLRYNTGGNVHDEVLKFLTQKTYLRWKYRNGSLTGQSNFAPADKPIVLLVNEQSLSDAEMTATGFKALKLGTIVGNETYRWIVFTTGTNLVDGSALRLPSWGCYTLDGKDIEFAGVQPDVKVLNNFDDKANGRDPQLDKAIELILEQLKKQ